MKMRIISSDFKPPMSHMKRLWVVPLEWMAEKKMKMWMDHVNRFSGSLMNVSTGMR